MTKKSRTRIQEINRLHGEVQGLKTEIEQKTKRIGQLLIDEKERLQHGEWLPWLKENCPDINERMAQNYMAVARGDQKTTHAVQRKSETVSDLPQNGEPVGALGMTPSKLKAETKRLREQRHERWKAKHGPDSEPPTAAESIRRSKEAGKAPKQTAKQEIQDDLDAAIFMIADEASEIKEALRKGAKIELIDEDQIAEFAAAVKYLQTIVRETN